MEIAKQTTNEIYFSCEAADRAQLEPLTEKLKLFGFNTRFEASPDLLASRAFVLVIGAQGISQGQQAEFKKAQKRASRDQKYRLFTGNRAFQLVVIILPAAPDNLKPETLALASVNYTLLDFRQGLSENASEKLYQTLNAPPPQPQLAIEPVSEPEIILEEEPDEAETQVEEISQIPATSKVRAKISSPKLKLLIYAGIGLVALLVILVLAEARNLKRQNLLITNEKLVAEENQKIALSREIAANATLIIKTDPQLSLLLAVEAAKTSPTTEAEQALRQAITRPVPRQLQFALANEGYSKIISTDLSKDGRFIALSLEPKDKNKAWAVQVWEILSEQKVAELEGNTMKVYDLTFSPDNKLLFTGGSSSTGQLWDIASQHSLFEIPTGGLGVIFSPDSKLVAARAFPEKFIKVFSTTNGAQIAEVKNTEPGQLIYRAEHGMAFSPDNKLLAYIAKKTEVFEIDTGKILSGFSNDTPSRGGIVFSPDGKLLADIDKNNNVRLWEVETGKLKTEIEVYPGSGEVWKIVFSPNGDTIATSSYNDVTIMFRINNSRQVGYIPGEYEAWSPDGQYILARNNRTNTLNLVDASDGRMLAEMPHPAGIVTGKFLAGGKAIVTVGSEYYSYQRESLNVWRWDIEQKTARATIKVNSKPINHLTFNPDGRLIATTSSDKTVQVLDANSGQVLATLSGHTEDVLNVIFSPDGKLLATVSRDATARLWEAETGRTKAILRGHTKPVNDAAFSPDGKYLVTVSDDYTARIWEVESGRTIMNLPTRAGLNGVVFSPDGKRFITYGANPSQLWETETGKLLSEINWGGSLTKTVVFSPDSKYFFLGGYTESSQVGEADTGRKIADLNGKIGTLKGVVFSPDSQKIATIEGTEGTGWIIRGWETSTGKEIAHNPSNFYGGFDASVFSPDGKFGVVLTDRLVYVWEVSTGQSVALIVIDKNYLQSSLTISPDNKQLAVGNSGGELKLYALPECGTLADLLGLARYKSYRELTALERDKYLHETVQP